MNPLLHELVEALKAFGVESYLPDGGPIEISDERGILWQWDGTNEEGAVLVLLRDQVRRVAPGTYVCPGGGYKPNGLISIMNLPCYGPPDQTNETTAYASALVALLGGGITPEATVRNFRTVQAKAGFEVHE